MPENQIGRSYGLGSPALNSTSQVYNPFVTPGQKPPVKQTTIGSLSFVSPSHQARKPLGLQQMSLANFPGAFPSNFTSSIVSLHQSTTSFQQNPKSLPLPSTQAATQVISKTEIVKTNPFDDTAHRESTSNNPFDEESPKRPLMSTKSIDYVEEYNVKNLEFVVDQADIYLTKLATLLSNRSLRKSAVDSVDSVTSSIPLFTIPPQNETSLEIYSKVVKIELTNENFVVCGTFGWCFMCRSSANFFCKDSRKPVCGKSCKEELLKFLGEVDKKLNLEAKLKSDKEDYRTDLLLLLDYIIDLIEKEMKEVNTRGTDAVLVGMVDNLALILERSSEAISSISHFKDTVKNRVFRIVGPLLLNFTPRCLKKTCDMVVILCRKFRHFLKKEIYIILDTIIISTINSQSANFNQRLYLLQLLSSVIGDKDMLVDIYVNYDCCSRYNGVVSRILNTLCKEYG